MLTVSLLIGLVAALGIFRLRVDTNHINFFSRSHPLGQSAAVIDSELAGVYSFQIMLEGPPDSLKTPGRAAANGSAARTSCARSRTSGR